jgi:hypothetical protein
MRGKRRDGTRPKFKRSEVETLLLLIQPESGQPMICHLTPWPGGSKIPGRFVKIY